MWEQSSAGHLVQGRMKRAWVPIPLLTGKWWATSLVWAGVVPSSAEWQNGGGLEVDDSHPIPWESKGRKLQLQKSGWIQIKLSLIRHIPKTEYGAGNTSVYINFGINWHHSRLLWIWRNGAHRDDLTCRRLLSYEAYAGSRYLVLQRLETAWATEGTR